jgi:hypothetical protein
MVLWQLRRNGCVCAHWQCPCQVSYPSMKPPARMLELCLPLWCCKKQHDTGVGLCTGTSALLLRAASSSAFNGHSDVQRWLVEVGAVEPEHRAHCRRFIKVLENYATSSSLRFTTLDHMYLALAWGFGQGAVHSALQFASLLPLTVGEGTFYYPECPGYSVFLAGALNSLSFWAILTAVSIIYFNAFDSKWPAQAVAASSLHIAASMLVSPL